MGKSQENSFLTGAGIGAILGALLVQETPKKEPEKRPLTNVEHETQNADISQKAEFERYNKERTAGDAALAARLQAEDDAEMARYIAREEARRAQR